VPGPLKRAVARIGRSPGPATPSLPGGCGQAHDLRLKCLLQWLPGCLQVQPQRPGPLVFDHNALDTIQVAREAPDHTAIPQLPYPEGPLGKATKAKFSPTLAASAWQKRLWQSSSSSTYREGADPTHSSWQCCGCPSTGSCCQRSEGRSAGRPRRSALTAGGGYRGTCLSHLANQAPHLDTGLASGERVTCEAAHGGAQHCLSEFSKGIFCSLQGAANLLDSQDTASGLFHASNSSNSSGSQDWRVRNERAPRRLLVLVGLGIIFLGRLKLAGLGQDGGHGFQVVIVCTWLWF
jgi:hypothetical protein